MRKRTETRTRPLMYALSKFIQKGMITTNIQHHQAQVKLRPGRTDIDTAGTIGNKLTI